MSAVTQKAIEWALYEESRRKLGTAAWMPDSQLKPFRIGDVWLGRTGNGQIAGVCDDRHILTCYGSRAGKGVSFIIPNLAFWPGSAVVIDPKGENAIVTARRRGKGSTWAEGLGQTIHILDPFDVVKTPVDQFEDLKGSFNPLDAIRTGDPEAVAMAFKIADAIIPGENANDPFWDDAAKEFISDLILHVASSEFIPRHGRNLLTVRKLLMAGYPDIAQLAAKMSPGKKSPSGYAVLFEHMKDNPAFDGVVSRAGARLAELEENSPRLFGSIAQTARTNTHFLEGPNMKRVLETSTFTLDALKRAKTGNTLYLCLPQRYMDTHYRWLRMMVTLVTIEMERQPYQPQSGHPVLMVLDEFPALKRMRVLENAAAQIAGYGVKLAVIVQTLAQLKELYKDNWETFVANSGVKLFSCNDDHFTREYVSKLIGEEDVVLYSKSGSQTAGQSQSQTFGSSSSVSGGSSWTMANGQVSITSNSGWSSSSNASRSHGVSASETLGYSGSIHKRPLLTPDEIGRQFGDRNNPRALVLISGHQPASLQRTLYFQEKVMAGSYGWHPDHAKPVTLETIRAQRQAKALADKRRAEEALRQKAEEERMRKEQEERLQVQEEKDERRAYWGKVVDFIVNVILTITCGAALLSILYWFALLPILRWSIRP